MKCSECIYWGHPMPKYREKKANECRIIDWVDHAKPSAKQMQFEARASDDTGLYARVLSGPDFGCVNFEKLE